MYYTTRYYYPNGIEGESMKCTYKEFDSLDKAIAYAHRYSNGRRFAGCTIMNDNCENVYELLENGSVF